MTNTASAILAPELLAHVAAPRALRVGDLATFLDFAKRQIGCSIVRMWAAGEITTEAQIEIRVVGAQHCYPSGAKFVVEASKVSGAV